MMPVIVTNVVICNYVCHCKNIIIIMYVTESNIEMIMKVTM
jgi:hypothetical protein